VNGLTHATIATAKPVYVRHRYIDVFHVLDVRLAEVQLDELNRQVGSLTVRGRLARSYAVQPMHRTLTHRVRNDLSCHQRVDLRNHRAGMSELLPLTRGKSSLYCPQDRVDTDVQSTRNIPVLLEATP
jgi:type VI protein secretion system component VasA